MQRNSQGTANGNGNKTYAFVSSFEVKRVREVPRPGAKGIINFDLTVNDVTIYGCSVFEMDNGRDFISFPARKGSDGKYYKIANIYLSDEDQNIILKEVERVIMNGAQ